MDRLPVRLGDHPHPFARFRHKSPEALPPIVLDLFAVGIGQDRLNPRVVVGFWMVDPCALSEISGGLNEAILPPREHRRDLWPGDHTYDAGTARRSF